MSFRLTVGMVSVLLIVAAFHQLAIAILSSAIFNGLLSAVLLFGALGLYMRVQWARILSITFLWGMILLAFGCMSPLRVSDDIAGGITPPSIQELAIQYFILSSFSIWCMHVLGKYKGKFRVAWYWADQHEDLSATSRKAASIDGAAYQAATRFITRNDYFATYITLWGSACVVAQALAIRLRKSLELFQWVNAWAPMPAKATARVRLRLARVPVRTPAEVKVL